MAEQQLSDDEKRRKLAKLISDFDTAMLVTRTADGGLRARPLAIAEGRDDGTLYFATSIDSGKVHELDIDSHVNVSMQKGRQFVSISGRARIDRDRRLIDRLWSDAWKVWFPGGKEDPSLCLIVVDPSDAEYWDSSGVTGLRYLFESAKAFVTGTRPDDKDDRQNAKVPIT